jgi:hypothetical protein
MRGQGIIILLAGDCGCQVSQQLPWTGPVLAILGR